MAFTNYDGKKKDNVIANSKRGRNHKDLENTIKKFEVKLPIKPLILRLIPNRTLIHRFVMRYAFLVSNPNNLSSWKVD